jgi:hypothetical protein
VSTKLHFLTSKSLGFAGTGAFFVPFSGVLEVSHLAKRPKNETFYPQKRQNIGRMTEILFQKLKRRKIPK